MMDVENATFEVGNTPQKSKKAAYPEGIAALKRLVLTVLDGQ